MSSSFVFNSVDDRRCFRVLVCEMIDVDNEFILDELLSDFVKKSEIFSLNLKRFVILTFLFFLSISSSKLIDDVLFFSEFISFCNSILRMTHLALSILSLLSF